MTSTQTPIFDSCINNLELIFNPSLLSFDEAMISCKEEFGGRLTIPKSVDWFDSFVPFLNGTGTDFAWVGLKDFQGTGGSLIATRFLDIETRPNPFSAVAGEEPWASNQPDDANGNETCVASIGLDRLLEDLPCSTTGPSVCERYCGDVPDNFVFDECIDDIQLFLNPNRQTFDAAVADCEAFDSAAHLAIPTDIDFFNRLTNFVDSRAGSESDLFIGLRDFTGEGGLSTSRFITVKGEVLDFYNVGVYNFPWSSSEPNDGGGVQDCATIIRDPRTFMGDTNCLQLLDSVCQRPCVSISGPTTSPTSYPTANPTPYPSLSPTQFLTISECQNNYEFLTTNEEVSFDVAAERCKQLGGRLTISRSIDWLNDFQSFLDGLQGQRRLWIGLRDVNEIGGNGVTSRFLDIEGRPNPFSFRAGETPWLTGEPNNFENQEHCVESFNNRLNDRACDVEIPFLCERYCGVLPTDFIFDECVDNIQFFFNPNQRSFDGANADCEAFDPNAHLAIPTDSNVFSRMREFLDSVPDRQTGTFIGLRDYAEIGGRGTSRFLTFDGDNLPFYDVGRGNFPWASGEPNDNRGTQKCGQIFRLNSKLMDDDNCVRRKESLCQRPCGNLSSSSTGTRIAYAFSTILIVGLLFASTILLFRKYQEIENLKQEIIFDGYGAF